MLRLVDEYLDRRGLLIASDRGEAGGVPARHGRSGDDCYIEFVFVAVVMVVVSVFLVAMIMVMVVLAGMPDDDLMGAGRQVVGARPFEGGFRFQELRIDFGGSAEIESTDIEDAIERQRAILGAVDPGDSVDIPKARLQGVELGRRDQVDLVE